MLLPCVSSATFLGLHNFKFVQLQFLSFPSLFLTLRDVLSSEIVTITDLISFSIEISTEIGLHKTTHLFVCSASINTIALMFIIDTMISIIKY